MADSILPVLFNRGLDTVTPPLMAEAGSLIDCLNYEITDIIGYRRIDGWENYDGFPNGNVTEFFRIDITATVGAEQSLIVPGSIIVRSESGLNPVAIGVVVGGPFPTNLYDIVPFQNTDSFIVNEEFLLYQDGVAFVQLQSNLGLLKIIGDIASLGSTFTIYPPAGGAIDASVGASLTEGGILMNAQDYINTLRTYAASLRATVSPAPGPVAGLYWFEDRLFAAINAIRFAITVADPDPAPLAGMRFRHNGIVYRVGKVVLEEDLASNVYGVYVYPIGTHATVNNNIDEITVAGVFVKTWGTTTSVTADNSEHAFIGYFHNPDTHITGGFTYVSSATTFNFTNGTYTASEFGPPPTFDEAGMYYAVSGDGNVVQVRLTNQQFDSGEFTLGTAAGMATVVVVSSIAGTKDYIRTGDVIHSVYPTTGSSAVMTVGSTISLGTAAGTLALDRNSSRYQWISGNFFANSESLSAYGTTGAGPAFWVNTLGFGNITTGIDASIDIPKYVAKHVSKLALGYARGSVLLSVAGEPHNFLGVAGAIEIAVGDNITGLIEMPGETLAVFGRRSIRKITGYTATDTTLGTISANTGCFDYTAVLIGQDAVYTGVHGITTLQQTASYGDFLGQRLSDSVSNWLRPKLVAGFRALEQGGTVCAYPVRYKNQYRLVLASGDIVVVTITTDGPKISKINLGLTGEVNIPYAWSSEIDQRGKERVHVTWNTRPRSAQVIELESGWGFNGRTFRHFFDMAHWFNKNGATYGGIERVRLHGQGYGASTLDVKTSGIEEDYKQDYHTTIQDISMPRNLETLYDALFPVTSIVDQASWGLGIKMRIGGTTSENTTLTEPPHICQAAVLHVRTDGALDT